MNKYKVVLTVQANGKSQSKTTHVSAVSVFEAKTAATKKLYGHYLPGVQRYMKVYKQ